MVRRALAVLVLLSSGCRSEPSSRAPAPAASAPSALPASVGDGEGETVEGLRFGAALEGTTLVTTLRNVGPIPLLVMSHVATHERQNDWIHVTVVGADGARRTIELNDDRDKSAAVTATIAPGEKLVDRWDLAAWAARKRNGGKGLAGATTLRATYTTRAEDYAGSTIPKGARPWVGSARSAISMVGG